MYDSRFARLGAGDMINLAAEAPGVPMHMTAVAILDGAALLDPVGRLRLAAIRRTVEDGLAAAPRLRQVLYSPGFLSGRPIWVDVDRFDIRAHVGHAVLPAPADEQSLLDLAAELMIPRLDRSRPLWRMWFVTGLPERRVGLVIVVHHVVADGLATAGLLLSLLDRPLVEPGPPEPPPVAATVPSRSALVFDNARAALARAAVSVRRAGAVGVRGALRPLASRTRAPRSASLNRPVGPRRRVGVLRMDLADAKRIAHAHGATVNDLVLGLASGGTRELLRARGEAVGSVVVTASAAVSLRETGAPGDVGNRTGAFLVDLPIGADGPADRLGCVAARTADAKRTQQPEAGTGILALMSRLGVARWLSIHQHMVQLVESDLTGPTAPVRLLGVPVLDLVPIGSLAGSVPISVLALSYAGRLVVAIHTDADAVPDAEMLLEGMRRDWDALCGLRLDATVGSDRRVTR